MKKRIVVIVALSLVLGLLGGCGGSQADRENKLYVYNWSEYIPEEVYQMFEDETGIEVVEAPFSSNEEMLAKMVAGGDEQYDIVVASNYVISAMKEQKLIQKLDISKIKNFANLTDAATGMDFDPKNEYSVPYMATITLLAVNEKKLNELGVTIDSYDDLLNPALKNNIVVPDDCREVVNMALKTLGEDPDSKDKATVKKAGAWLKKLAPNVKLYDSDTPFQALATNEVAVGLVYNMDAAKAMNANKDIKLVQVKEANEMAYDNFVISSKSKNKDAALKFINFIHKPEIYKKCLEEYPCVCLNKETIKIMDEKWLANPAANVDQGIIEKAHVTGDVGSAASYYDDVFAAMKN